MFEETWSKTMDDISESELESAMGFYYRKKKSITMWRRATAAAVALVILVTALVLWPVNDEPEIIAMPGIIQAYACETSDPENGIVDIRHGLNIGANATQNTVLYPYMTSDTGLGMTLKVEEKALLEHQISFDISCNYGVLYAMEESFLSGLMGFGYAMVSHEQNLTIQNGEMFFWRRELPDDYFYDPEFSLQAMLEGESGLYMQVLIRADGNIVGFTVFEMICMDQQMQFYGVTMRESVYYPKVDGQFQPITEEYVQEQIQSCDIKPMAGNALAHGGVYHSARTSQESVDCIFMSTCHGIRYTCHVFDQRYADREITFDISVDFGRIRADKEYYADSCTLNNDTVFFWHGGSVSSEMMGEDGAAYLDVIIRADGEVIGYAVIKIGYVYSFNPETGIRDEHPMGYGADSCYSVVYLPEDGQLPDLTEEEVREMIEACKQEQKNQDSQ